MIDHNEELRRRWIREYQRRPYADDYLYSAWLRAVNWLRTTSSCGWVVDRKAQRRSAS